MRFLHDPLHSRLELTRRNLEMLLANLDDPESLCELLKDDEAGDARITVVAVENVEHYGVENSIRKPWKVYMPTKRGYW